MKREKNDNGIIIGIIVSTIVILCGLYFLDKALFYEPPGVKSKETNSTTEVSNASGNTKEDTDVSINQISSIDGELKKSFETIGKEAVYKEMIHDGADDSHLRVFTDYYGGSIEFENNKSAYSWIKGKPVIEDTGLKMYRIVLASENENTKLIPQSSAYILMEIPYTINCTTVSDDPMYEEFKKYEGTDVGNGLFYSDITLKQISIDGDTVVTDGSSDVKCFNTLEEAEEKITALGKGSDEEIKTFDF